MAEIERSLTPEEIGFGENHDEEPCDCGCHTPGIEPTPGCCADGTCPDCEEQIDPDTARWSDVKETYYCEDCFIGAGQYASTAWYVEPGSEAVRYVVTDVEISDEYGDSAIEMLERRWVSSSAWRGYYETKPKAEGWVEAKNGWTTGDWGDAVSDSKQDFNEWVSTLLTGESEPPFPMWVIADLTSNVFSTAMTIFVPEGQTLTDVPDF